MHENDCKKNILPIKRQYKIWGFTISGFNGYFYNRNARIIKNRNFANGRIDVQTMFQDRFQNRYRCG